MAATTDLFGWIDALWTKKKPEGTPPTFMMHRFLASDQLFAQVARELQVEVRDPQLVFGCWQAILPRDRAAPRLAYVAPKKSAAAEELVEKMCLTLCEGRAAVEQMIDVVQLAGKLDDLYWEFGVDPDEE